MNVKCSNIACEFRFDCLMFMRKDRDIELYKEYQCENKDSYHFIKINHEEILDQHLAQKIAANIYRSIGNDL